MAERRMFAKSIIGSARFLRMPPTSRLLYYDLGMQADDDGVVEAFAVMRTTGATEDDLRVLATKGFITVLNEDLVTHITDWKRNNLIKSDRYHPSLYADLLVKISDGTQLEPTWNPDGTQVEPEVRLGKDSIGESVGASAPSHPHLDLGRTLAEQTGPFADPRAVIAGAQKELERIEAQDTARELATPAEVLLSFQEHREQMDSGTGVSFVPTGFRNLDTLLGGGMLSGGLYLLAARPGMGKTSLALCIADKAAARGPVLFVSLEMDPEQLSAKRLARETGIPSDKLLFGGLTSEEYDRVAQGSVSLSKLSLYLNRRPQATVEDIATLARKVKGLQLLVIDYFGLIQPSEKGRSRYESATEISGRLKALARSLKVPILCLAQLNRENMERRDKRPQLSDLRDTGALEQDADGVMLLHRPDYYEAKGDKLDPWEPTPVEVILAKNRHASTGVCHIIFYLATCRVLQEARARGA